MNAIQTSQTPPQTTFCGARKENKMNVITSNFQSLENVAAQTSNHWKKEEGFFMMDSPALPQKQEIRIRRILVPVDFSGPSTVSLEYAASLSRAMGAAVTLFHVVRVDLAHDPAGHAPESVDKKCELMLAQLQVLADLFWRGEQRVDVAVSVGDVCKEIVRQARDTEADLIVMTTKRCGGILRLFRRDTSASVAREAPCPVMLARLFETGGGWKPVSAIAA